MIRNLDLCFIKSVSYHSSLKYHHWEEGGGSDLDEIACNSVELSTTEQHSEFKTNLIYVELLLHNFTVNLLLDGFMMIIKFSPKRKWGIFRLWLRDKQKYKSFIKNAAQSSSWDWEMKKSFKADSNVKLIFFFQGFGDVWQGWSHKMTNI